MDYKAMAEAALTRAAGLQAEARTVLADESLTDADKRSRVEAMNADIASAIDEARGYTESGEREQEVRSLMERSGALHGKPEGRENGENVSDMLRSLARGEVREVVLTGRAGIESPATRAATDVQTTDGAKGESNTIPRTFVGQVIESLREQSPVFSLARIITTTGGEPLDYPVLNAHYLPDGAYQATSEGNAFSKGTVDFAKVSLGATKYGCLVEISRDLIEDSHIDFAGFVARDMGGELARKTASDAMAALDVAAVVGVTVDAGAATPITGDDLMAMYHSIVTGYRKNAAYVFNDATALTIRKVKDSYGQYLWQPGLQAGMPDVLLGRPVHTDYNVAQLPTSTSAAPGTTVGYFGDFDRGFVIRQVNDLRIVRSDEYGFDRDTVTFRATWRGDFKVVDGAAIRSLNATHA